MICVFPQLNPLSEKVEHNGPSNLPLAVSKQLPSLCKQQTNMSRSFIPFALSVSFSFDYREDLARPGVDTKLLDGWNRMKLCHSDAKITHKTLSVRLLSPHTCKNYIKKWLLGELLRRSGIPLHTDKERRKSFVEGKSYCETANALKLEILSTPNCLDVHNPQWMNQFRE